MVANGRLEGTKHIIYVDPEIYGKKADFSDVARAVGRGENDKLDGERYILVGPGPLGELEPACSAGARAATTSCRTPAVW